MRIFVTGGTGNIGYWLVKYLAEEGHNVHALVRNTADCEHLKIPGVKLFEGDVTHPNTITKAIDGCSGVFHLAALVKVWDKNEDNFRRINIEGTKNTLDAAQLAGVEKFIYCSSAGSFGPSINHKVSETTVRTLPFFNLYEKTKAEGEELVKTFGRQGLKYNIVSPTRVFGPAIARAPDSASLLIHKFVNTNWRLIPGNGHQIGNYAYVHDVVAGMVKVMRVGKSGEHYILGGENASFDLFFETLATVSQIQRKLFHIPLVIIELYTQIEKFKTLFGVEPLITPDWTAKMKYNWEIDISKAINQLQYKVTDFETALLETVEFYKKNK
jgi:farnesol dehydrogenase